MKRKLKYPEYINGIRQEQNPIKRFLIRLWYSDWFRLFFIICPVWLFALTVILWIIFHGYGGPIRFGLGVTYIVVFSAGLFFNDYEQLNRIGLDVYHKPLSEEDED